MTTIAKPLKTPADAEPTDRRWTRQEYYQLLDGGYFQGQRVELIEGRILQLSPQRGPHSVGVEKVDSALRTAFGPGFRFRAQLPLHCGDRSEPEPDFAVVAGNFPPAPFEHPTSAVLIIEVSDTTLDHDRKKARLYAANGIEEYWIVNLVFRSLEVHRKPQIASPPAGAAYADVRILGEQDHVSPLGAPGAQIKVADLLP